MGVDRGALSISTECRINKIRGLNSKKMSQKRDEICSKKYPGTHKETPFIQKFYGTLERSLASLELNFTVPIEITWLRLCKMLFFGKELKRLIYS